MDSSNLESLGSPLYAEPKNEGGVGLRSGERRLEGESERDRDLDRDLDRDRESDLERRLLRLGGDRDSDRLRLRFFFLDGSSSCLELGGLLFSRYFRRLGSSRRGS